MHAAPSPMYSMYSPFSPVRSVHVRVVALALLAAPGVATGQSRASVHPLPPPVARAVRRTGEVRVDGRLDDPAWAAAAPITRFTQTRPTEGAPATQRTEVRVLYDDDAIYVGARMYDSLGGAGVRTRLARRDEQLDLEDAQSGQITSDQLVVTFDTYHDHLSRALFALNPSGVKSDGLALGGGNLDGSWDPVWEGAARIDSLGWTAEMRIPLAQLRYGHDSVQTWGMQVVRIVDRLAEHDAWAFWKRDESGGPQRFGHLEGLALPAARHALELLPYAVSEAQFLTPVAADPFRVGRGASARVGADVKYSVSSNLTLDATVNPDFGQVEVDPSVVNLSAYETFYPEKRPFFVANSGAFSFGEFNCYFCSNVSSLDVFYSRRIGRPPQLGGYASDLATYADVPDKTTILGAAKLTGRTASGTSIGVLEALTNRENARYQDSPAGPRFRQEVEPLTNYFVGRLKHDYRQGATTVGGILTSVLRRLDDGVVADSLRRNAEAAGLDFSTAWHARDYRLMGQLVLSDVGGSAAAIARTQQSSAHYFQRPDRRARGDGLFGDAYDTTATALRGYGAYLRIAKENGRLLWETAVNARSPGFEVNDLAYLNRADYVWQNANVVGQWTQPTRWYRTLDIGAGSQWQHDYDGDVTDFQEQVGAVIELPNYWNIQWFSVHHPSVIDDRMTRGGPDVRSDGYDLLIVGASTDARRAAVLGVNANVARGIDSPALSWQASPSLLVKPSASLAVTFGPSLAVARGAAQYVTRVSDTTATRFYGARYVFADLKQVSLSFDTRASLAFTPTLTLDVFAQPFVSTGAYTAFGEYARPRSRRRVPYAAAGGTIDTLRDEHGAVASYRIDPDGTGPARPFTIDDPDFSVRSLRGNAVLRWEYRPGSTIFVVWTQQRFSSDASGDFSLTRDRVELARAHPDNVFLVKATFWVGR